MIGNTHLNWWPVFKQKNFLRSSLWSPDALVPHDKLTWHFILLRRIIFIKFLNHMFWISKTVKAKLQTLPRLILAQHVLAMHCTSGNNIVQKSFQCNNIVQVNFLYYNIVQVSCPSYEGGVSLTSRFIYSSQTSIYILLYIRTFVLHTIFFFNVLLYICTWIWFTYFVLRTQIR